MRLIGIGVVLLAVGCGRSGELVSSSPSNTVADLAGPVVDLAAGSCGGVVCPPPLQCVDGQCCGGMICVPPPQMCDRQHPCPPGEQCFNGMCFPAPPDFGRRQDMGRRGDMGALRDMATLQDMAAPRDMSTVADLSAPPADLSVGSDGGVTSGCTRDDQCPGARCDWLTGQCVPIESCNVDRDCPNGSACVGHQCLPIQICSPFPGSPPCPSGTHCAFPPGVCVPNPDCGPNAGTCPGGERCVGGYCQPDGCMSSADCNDGYDCVGGKCQPVRYCGRFDRCPRQMHCSAHVCVP
jgi:hypothetical protein